jgi:DNA-directed RNA polymerase subunit alpha
MSEQKPPPFIPLSLDFGAAPVAATVRPTSRAPAAHDPKLDMLVDELELSVRTAMCLQEGNIRYIGELVQKTELELLTIKNFGRKSLVELRLILGEMGLPMHTTLDGWKPPR